MRRALMALAILGLPSPLLAQGGDLTEEQEACVAAGGCRTVESLRLEGPDGTVQDIPMGITIPWLTQGNIMLTPGEAVTIALEEIEGILVPSLVATGDEARDRPLGEGQVRFDLGQFESGRLTLTVLSRYSENLDYGAVKVAIGSGPERTSVCTLMPGIAAIELWQEPIYQMALFGFRTSAEEPGCKVIDMEGDLQSSEA